MDNKQLLKLLDVLHDTNVILNEHVIEHVKDPKVRYLLNDNIRKQRQLISIIKGGIYNERGNNSK